jgi:hypothetical protein
MTPDARAATRSTTGREADAARPSVPNVCDPDTGHWLIRNGLGRDDVVVRETGPVGADTASSEVAGP